MVRSNLQYRSSALKPHTKKLKDKLYKMYKKEQHVMSHITFTILKVYLICYIILIGGALFHRRNICRLSMLYKITHRLVAIDQNLYLVPQTTTITPSSSLSDLQYTYWLLQILVQLFSSHRDTVELLSTLGGISSLYAYWQCRWV